MVRKVGERDRDDPRAPAAARPDDRPGVAQLGAQRVAGGVASPRDESAAGPQERQPELDALRERPDRPHGHDVPGSSLLGVLGEVLSALREDLDRRRVHALLDERLDDGVRGHREEAGLLGDRLHERHAPPAQGGRERQARVAAAAPEVEQRPRRVRVGSADRSGSLPRTATALSESQTCRRATATGSRIDVRLMAAPHAASRRACAS